MFKELNIVLNKKPFYKSFRVRLEDKTPEHDIRVKRNIISGSINININLKVLNSEKIRDYLMRMNGNVRLIGILVLGMLVLAMVQVVSADGEVTWYLRRAAASGFSYPDGHVSDKIMPRDTPTHTNSESVTLSAGDESWWYTDQIAECDLAFPSGNWQVTFWAELSTTFQIKERM